MPASSAAAQKLEKERGLRPSRSCVVSTKAKFSPKKAVRTVAAAADCVLWPLGYSGNGGVMRIAYHLGSITRRM
jgi:hypothetical protein